MQNHVSTNCCIVGGGPAGLLLGYLLARAGIEVIVLEKHDDFLRDFRGDTVHPSTLEVLYELGLLDEFLQRPHQKLSQLAIVINGEPVRLVDLTHLPTHCKFIAMMPQWEFLDFIASKAQAYTPFKLWMRAEATTLIVEDGRVQGVVVEHDGGQIEVRARLVVAADGRNSRMREAAGLIVEDQGAPIDVLWLRVAKENGSTELFGQIAPGRIVVTIDRGDYWQVAYVIHKNGFDEVKQRGLPALRQDLATLAPQLRAHIDDVQTWDDVKLLTVRVDRLKKWYKEGLLCIGDAAHAMSPVGGIGINLAIQDAVAAANLLTVPLLENRISLNDLESVQKRRELPTKLTQRAQVFVQDNILNAVLKTTQSFNAPWFARLLNRFPLLRRLPARVLGLGVRPEHYHGIPQ